MIKYLSAFKDDVAGTFDYFGAFANVELAKRAFKFATSSSECPATDLSLYVIGNFDTNTGDIYNVDDELGKYPQYVMRGVNDEI